MLSETTRRILGLIAEGRSYDQILQQYPELTYFDIFAAAREALELAELTPLNLPPISPRPPDRLPPWISAKAQPEPSILDAESPAPTSKRVSFIERARATHRRAWARWTHEEDSLLTTLFERGASRREMEQALGRQPGAIRSRLLKLGLITEIDEEVVTSVELGPDQKSDIDASSSVQEATEGRYAEHVVASPAVHGWESFRQRLSADLNMT